jgi:uncharacterized protein (UPF0254 family)
MDTSTVLGISAVAGIIIGALLINHVINESHARKKRHAELMQALENITEKLK